MAGASKTKCQGRTRRKKCPGTFDVSGVANWRFISVLIVVRSPRSCKRNFHLSAGRIEGISAIYTEEDVEKKICPPIRSEMPDFHRCLGIRETLAVLIFLIAKFCCCVETVI